MSSPAVNRVSPVRPGRGRAYLELLRPANVATALADVLAGAAIATSGAGLTRVYWLLAASACLYAGGIVLNDFFDRHLDATERPERPIPSGRVSAVAAFGLGAVLLIAGVALASLAGIVPMFVAGAVAAAVLTYDAWSKHHPILGPVNMGLCRALNLAIGMALVPAALSAHWPLALLPLAYIAGVTVVSRGEVNGSKRPVALVGLVLISFVVMALAVLPWLVPPVPASADNFPHLRRLWAVMLGLWLAWRVLPAFARAVLDPTPGPIRHAVRTGVLSLVLVDSVIAASYAGIIYSLAVLATGLLAWGLARLFAVT